MQLEFLLNIFVSQQRSMHGPLQVTPMTTPRNANQGSFFNRSLSKEHPFILGILELYGLIQWWNGVHTYSGMQIFRWSLTSCVIIVPWSSDRHKSIRAWLSTVSITTYHRQTYQLWLRYKDKPTILNWLFTRRSPLKLKFPWRLHRLCSTSYNQQIWQSWYRHISQLTWMYHLRQHALYTLSLRPFTRS